MNAKQGIQNIATFRAPKFVPLSISDRDSLFAAETQMSEFLAVGLTNKDFAIGPVLQDYKTSSIARKVGDQNRWIWVCVSYDRKNDVWDVEVKANEGLMWRILGRSTDKERERLCKAIDEILKTDTAIKDVRWQTMDEWLSAERIE